MASNELRNKTELTSVTGDEWVYVQENASPYAVKKVQIDTIAAYAGLGEIVGKTADYVITDIDSVKRVEVDTTAGDITITLPLLANNIGRRIEIANVKGGTYKVIIRPNATDANKLSSDALNAIWLPKIGDYAIFQQSLTSGFWEIVGESITSQLRLNTYAGYGSTDNKIMRFTNVVENVGNMFSENHVSGYTGNTKGLEITINRSGRYSFTFWNPSQVNISDYGGISLNSNQLTTSIPSIPLVNILSLHGFSAISSGNNMQWTDTIALYLKKGDIIRPHTSGLVPAGGGSIFIVSYIGQ